MKLRLNGISKEKTEFINDIIKKYHFDEKDREELKNVYEELVAYMTPYAIYRINQWVTGVRKIDENQVALVAITLGKGPDELLDKYVNEGAVNREYMVECMSNDILLNLYQEFNQNYGKIHRRYVSGYVFVGDEVPLTSIRDILLLLQENEADGMVIRANEYGVITPSKSVLFYALLSDNPKNACGGICEGCSNINCNQREKKDSIRLNYGFQRIFGIR